MSPRVALVLGFAAFVLAVYALMLRGWRARQRRQGFLPAPATPGEDAQLLAGPVPGLLVGTVFAGRWLDRVAVHGLSDRATAELSVTSEGVRIDRDGGAPLLLPAADLVTAEPGAALAGRVVGRDGLLLVTWRLGPAELTTGFRAEQHAEHARLAAAACGLRAGGVGRA